MHARTSCNTRQEEQVAGHACLHAQPTLSYNEPDVIFAHANRCFQRSPTPVARSDSSSALSELPPPVCIVLPPRVLRDIQRQRLTRPPLRHVAVRLRPSSYHLNLDVNSHNAVQCTLDPLDTQLTPTQKPNPKTIELPNWCAHRWPHRNVRFLRTWSSADVRRPALGAEEHTCIHSQTAASSLALRQL
jgi:hypothetical protein